MTLSYQQTIDFTRWISDDRFLGQWYVADAEGVNIRNAVWVTLSNNNKTLSTVSSPDWYIIAFMTDVNNWVDSNNTYWICQGKVFDVDSWSGWLNTLSSARNATFITNWSTTYWAIITTTDIWRWDNSTSSITTAASYLSTLTDTSDYRAIYLDWPFLYVWGNKITYCIDCSTSTWVVYKTVTIPWVCRAITKVWDQIFIYTNDWNNWYKCSWDWQSAFPLYIQKWADNPVLNVANMGNVDYVITWAGSLDQTQKYRRLFMSTWFEKQLISGSEFILNTKQLLNFNPIESNAIETYWNVIYFPWTNVIYTYGSTKKALPPSLSKDIVIDDDVLRITALYVTNANRMYIGYVNNDWTIKYTYQDLREWYAYWTSGYVSTLAYTWWDTETQKMNNRLVFNYELPTDTNIKIYTRTDWYKYRVFNCSPIITPTEWDTYTHNGVTYTVVRFTNNDELVCTRDLQSPQYNSVLRTSGTLTKTFGVWDASLAFTNCDNFILLDSLPTGKRKHTITYKEPRYDLQVKVQLESDNQNTTPTLYSVKTLFGFNDQDVW